MRALPDRLCFVLCLATRCLGLTASRGEESSCLLFGLVELPLDVFVKPSPQLINLGEPARPQVIALARRVRPHGVGLTTCGFLELRHLDGRALDHVARLLLSEPQNVICSTAYPGVVDLPAILLAGRLKLISYRVELLLEPGHVSAGLNDVRFKRSYV